ncbi:MAG: type II secretion system F family protein [Bryobacterales bacterium]
MLLFLIFFTVIALFMVATVVIAYKVMHRRDIDQMKNLVSGRASLDKGKGGSATTLIKDDTLNARQALARMFLGKNLNEKLRDYIEQGGLDWDPARTVYSSLLLAVLGFNLFWYFIPRGQPIAVLGVLLGAGAPFFFIFQKRRARLRAFEEQFPDALEFVSRAMRTGHAFSVSLEMLHKEYAAPLGVEFRRTFEEQNLGLPLEVALERLGTRIPLLDVKFFVSSVLLQKRTGGNLASLLDNLAYLIRERFKLRGRIRAISAHGRISGLVLSMIPLAVAIMMFYTNPDYVLFFLDDPDGKLMMAVCIMLQFLGFVSIKKITDIGV